MKSSWTAGALALAISAFVSQAQSDEPAVPLKRVVVFNSGVAFFDHVGEVEGDQEIQFRFHVRDVNDLLKSMVLQDFDGGQISTVTYDAREPITRTLQSLAIDLTRGTSLAELLRQIRGHRVKLLTAGEELEGTIVGVTSRTRRVDESRMEEDVLLIKSPGGLRKFTLDDLDQIRLLDEQLEREFQQALDLLATRHRDQWKTVTIRFQGEGQRRVRVGYVQEFPVWKTSYRLVLGDDKPAHLQGWAIVENTTEHNWKDVQLILVSGRPISFVMDLYEPLFVQRPQVVPESFAALRPRTHDQDLQPAADPVAGFGPGGKPLVRVERSRQMYGMGGGMGGMGGMGLGGMAGEEFEPAAPPIDPSQGIASAALGEEAGELFRYVIEQPVTLARQHSAMLPIVNQQVETAKLSIYNASVHDKHPLDGVRLTNTTNLHWMQGPITVFDGDQYAGDARLGDVPPGAERLISYALDLDIEVARESKPAMRTLEQLTLAAHQLTTRHRTLREQQYRIKSSRDKVQSLLVEQPRDAAWELASPAQPAETTRSLYRFHREVAAGAVTDLTVSEQQFSDQQLTVISLKDEQLRVFLDSSQASAEVKGQLAKLLKLRGELGEVRETRGELERQYKLAASNQARVRSNLSPLSRDSGEYRDYVQRLVSYDKKLDELQPQIEALYAKEVELRRELGDPTGANPPEVGPFR